MLRESVSAALPRVPHRFRQRVRSRVPVGGAL